jgi:hypothetical protein
VETLGSAAVGRKWVLFEISGGPTVRVTFKGMRSLAHRGKITEALRAAVEELS